MCCQRIRPRQLCGREVGMCTYVPSHGSLRRLRVPVRSIRCERSDRACPALRGVSSNRSARRAVWTEKSYGAVALVSGFGEMGFPSQCSSLGECLQAGPGHRSTTRARTRICGAGSRMTERAWTTWTGCAGRRASGVRCARGSRRGSSRTVGGRAVAAVVASRRRRERSFTAPGRR